MATKFGIGQALRRVEDERLITGAGCYTADLLPKGATFAVVVRSPHAHARFTIGDLAEVRAMPGVLLVLTHADVADLGGLPCPGAAAVTPADGSRMKLPPYPVLPKDEVRHIGEAVAFIVAESDAAGREAAEAFPIDYEPLDAVVGIAGAEVDEVLVWPDLGTNTAFEMAIGDAAQTDAAFAAAARVVDLTVVNSRVVANYMEPRACLAEYDGEARRWTITLGSQGSHGIRDTLARVILKVDPARIRVITPDVGGGFGTKIFMYREYPLCAVAAERLGRPVRWVSDRNEHFVADAHGRDNVSTAQMALDGKGRFLGMRVDLRADLGAYLSQFAPFIPAVGARMTPGCYDVPALHVRIRGFYTHTVPVDAYRGAGRPEAAYLIERFVDHIARTIGMDRAELRAVNFVAPASMPHATQTGRVYDSGEFEGHMRRAMELGDWQGFEARRVRSAAAGRLRGIGLASYIEACSGGGPEKAEVRLEGDGTVTVRIGTQSTGQGHLTAYTQLVCEHLLLPPEKVRVLQGDTDQVKTGGGTGGSRSIPVGGASVASASRTMAERLKNLAADALEAPAADLEIVEGGGVGVVGTDRRIDFASLAALPQAAEQLAVEEGWTPPEFTYPNGTHVCEVEIDAETGEVAIDRYTVIDDFGVTLNPLLLAGQVHGGIMQGVGQALHERTLFDEDGQLVTASFMDYRMPRAADLPDITFETRNVPCKTNLLGMKGAGEAGSIGATPATVNAVCDALWHAFGITHVDMPVTADKLFDILRAHRAVQAA